LEADLAIDFPPNMDFLDLWQEKMFLGQEFLTWLWLTSEQSPNFEGPRGSEVEVWFEKSMVLQTGHGQNRSQVVCQNPDHDWTEAFVALGVHKKITKANVHIRTESFDCSLVLPADTLSPQSVKLNSGAEFTDDDDGPLSQTGHFLNQVSLVSTIVTILERIFQTFLKIRLSEAWETEELPKLREFLKPKLVVPEI
jgi:recombination associated protein RdgC